MRPLVGPTRGAHRFAKNVHEIKITAKRNIQSAKENGLDLPMINAQEGK